MDFHSPVYSYVPLSPTRVLPDLKTSSWCPMQEAETVYPSRATEFNPSFGGVHVAKLFSSLCCVFCLSPFCVLCTMIPLGLL